MSQQNPLPRRSGSPLPLQLRRPTRASHLSLVCCSFQPRPTTLSSRFWKETSCPPVRCLSYNSIEYPRGYNFGKTHHSSHQLQPPGAHVGNHRQSRHSQSALSFAVARPANRHAARRPPRPRFLSSESALFTRRPRTRPRTISLCPSKLDSTSSTHLHHHSSSGKGYLLTPAPLRLASSRLLSAPPTHFSPFTS